MKIIDKLRTATAEEIVELLFSDSDMALWCEIVPMHICPNDCRICIRNWLESEVEDE